MSVLGVILVIVTTIYYLDFFFLARHNILSYFKITLNSFQITIILTVKEITTHTLVSKKS